MTGTVAGANLRGMLTILEAFVGALLAPELVSLIEQIARENPLWSRRRIASELAKLGYAVDKDTVAKYLPKPARRPRRPPSQTWKTFLRNHLAGTVAIDCAPGKPGQRGGWSELKLWNAARG